MAEAFLTSWPADPGLSIALVLTAIIYGRGWLHLRRRDARRWHRGKLAAFVGGLTTVFLALASPIEPFSFFFLQVHMVQHLLLMMVAPPLLWLGDPLFPLLRGLPAPIRTYWVLPWFRSRWLRQLFAWLTHPVPALLLYVGTSWAWHLPALYELALRSTNWHYLQHAMFLGTGLLFWFPVVRPYPSRPRWSRWLLFPYLILADVQNTTLAALLTFSDRVLYPHYERVPRLDGQSVLDDQGAAGVIMWVPGSIAYLLPLFVLALRSLFGVSRSEQWSGQGRAKSRTISLHVVSDSSPRDLLRVPMLGSFLRGRYARYCVQLPLFLLAVCMIYDGLTGPEVAPMNLAGVLPWIHWRGLLILGLLVLGNVFCMACPFMLPRTLARKLLPQPFTWPRPLRNKWLAIGLLIVFLWAYEAFALWDSPWLTAWIAIGYFAGALVIDGLFRGAAFCKYVCPIGQFNFIQSLLSPFEVKRRDAAVCASCRTKDCIRGNETSRGCELALFVPHKSSNLDCTLCLDCIHACPHDNIGIVAVVPGAELWRDPSRSGIGRLSRRPDIATLIVLLVFGAFANAAGMIAPVAEWQESVRVTWGLPSLFWVVTIYYLFALVFLPFVLVGVAAASSKWWGDRSLGWRRTAFRYSYSLVPLGFAMWLSHYSFHLLTSYDAVLPAAQCFLGIGSPDWSNACCRPVSNWIPRLEIIILDFGMLLSLYTAYRIADRSWKPLLPWALLVVLLFTTGVWIVLQPMQMRGTMTLGG